MKRVVEISVVLATRGNRLSLLNQCLESIQRSTYASYEVILVSNGKGNYKSLLKKFPFVRCIVLPIPYGAYALSIAVANASGNYILQIDDDSRIYPNTLKKIVSYFKKVPKTVGALTFEIYDIKTQTYLYKTHKKYEILNPKDFPGFSGNGAAFRKEIFKKTGYYDKNFILYEHEIDLSLRIINAGFAIHQVTDIIIDHFHENKKKVVGESVFLGFRNSVWLSLKYFPVSIIPLLLLRTMMQLGFSTISRSSLKVLLYGMAGYLSGLCTFYVPLKKRGALSKRTQEIYFQLCSLDLLKVPYFSRFTIRSNPRS